MAQLRIDALCKGWDYPVIDELSFTVDEGEFFVIVGPSGIGKTTLLRLIAGLESSDAGQVLLGERNLTSLPPYHRRVAMTFESYALYPHQTVFDNIASPLRARGESRATIKTRVNEVASLLQIQQLLDRKPGEVSGGQKQRTALGRTLVAKPDVFLLDEPLSHLDAKIRHELRTQFRSLEELRRVPTIYVTHDYAEALSLGDRIGVMGAGGRLVQTGRPRELFEQPVNLFVAKHLGQPTINVLDAELVQSDGRLYVQPGNSRARFPVAETHRAELERIGIDQITLGVRPQAIRPVDELKHGHPLRVRVDVFEALGSMGVMTAESDGIKLTALTSPERYFDANDEVSLHIDTGAFYYFDRRSGSNLLLN